MSIVTTATHGLNDQLLDHMSMVAMIMIVCFIRLVLHTVTTIIAYDYECEEY